MAEPLVHFPIERWSEIQEVLKKDYPRSICGYTALETQRIWKEKGYEYEFTVYCPYGDPDLGMVAVIIKNTFYEIIIQCPIDETTKLEEALKTTKEIDWKRKIIIPFAPTHVMECVKRIVDDVQAKIELILPSESFFLDKDTPVFNVRLPQDFRFDILTPDHVELVNACWPHRYPGSEWYFQLLIKTKSGFGMFKDNTLISWVFINEAGTLGHMYTVEDQRRNGYGKLILQLACNKILREGKDVVTFAAKGNQGACELYKNIGFKNFDGVDLTWCFFNGE